LTNGTNQYILSNNHVLGRSGQAVAGEDVSQPGLIDNNCAAATIVGDFTAAPLLGPSNVDAAVAQLRTGTMDANGSILDIGQISSVVRAPALGLAVKKSGRTTGLTSSTVTSINTDVRVQYQKGCGKGKKFTVTFNDQVVIGGSGFSAGGDSGSLIVTNNACAQPVALLYAGSSTSTIGNPIGEVLTQVGAALGGSVQFVGATCSSSFTTSSAGPTEAELTRARNIKNRHKGNMLELPGILGVGVGVADDNPTEAVIVVYVERGRPRPGVIADRVDGVRVKVVNTEEFTAFGDKAWGR
ncbi:MAG: hypothetical protein ACREUU_00705, partial [Gammaproteobacteria bacterium]